MSGWRKFRLGLLLLLLALSCAGGVGYWAFARFLRFADAPIPGLEPGSRVLVGRGDVFTSVLGKLHAAGVPKGRALEWRLLAHSLGAADDIKVGEYALEPGVTTPRRLLLDMRAGKVVAYRFTIVEGWNIRELRAALAKAAPLEQRSRGMDDAELMRALGLPGRHPEGRFLPETYVYARGDSDLDLLRRAHQALEKALDAAWAGRSPGLPLRRREDALILASIIEKETGVAAERAQIAGVFVRRLRLGMLLQTDPTVIYGMGERYRGNLRRVDLTTDTPYNTYTRAGLPPTPIAMAGVDALHAATHPADGDALFFVAIGDGSGRHMFSRTLGEHQRAVRDYLDRLRRQRAVTTAGDAAAPTVTR